METAAESSPDKAPSVGPVQQQNAPPPESTLGSSKRRKRHLEQPHWTNANEQLKEAIARATEAEALVGEASKKLKEYEIELDKYRLLDQHGIQDTASTDIIKRLDDETRRLNEENKRLTESNNRFSVSITALVSQRNMESERANTLDKECSRLRNDVRRLAQENHALSTFPTPTYAPTYANAPVMNHNGYQQLALNQSNQSVAAANFHIRSQESKIAELQRHCANFQDECKRQRARLDDRERTDRDLQSRRGEYLNDLFTQLSELKTCNEKLDATCKQQRELLKKYEDSRSDLPNPQSRSEAGINGVAAKLPETSPTNEQLQEQCNKQLVRLGEHEKFQQDLQARTGVDIHSVATKFNELEIRNKQLQDACKQQQDACKQHQATISEHAKFRQHILARTGADLDSVVTKLDTLVSRNNFLQKQNKKYEHRIETVENELKWRQTDNSQENAPPNQRERLDNDAFRETCVYAFSALPEEITTKLKRLNDLQVQHDMVMGRNRDLESKIKQVDGQLMASKVADIPTMTGEQRRRVSSYPRLLKEYEEMKEKTEALQKENAVLGAKITDLTSKYEDAEAHIDLKDADFANLQADLMNLRTGRTSLTSNAKQGDTIKPPEYINKLEKQVSSLTTKNKDTSLQIEEKQEEIHQLRKDLLKERDAYSMLHSTLSDNIQRLTEAENTARAGKEALNDYERVYNITEHYRKEIADLKEKDRVTSSKLAQLQEELAEQGQLLQKEKRAVRLHELTISEFKLREAKAMRY